VQFFVADGTKFKNRNVDKNQKKNKLKPEGTKSLRRHSFPLRHICSENKQIAEV
jgi:hypothetical protein